ncbi:MAG: hypothetical protein ABIK89_19000 [Planctomycetota bacterium]
MKVLFWEVRRSSAVIGYIWATRAQITEATEYGRSIGDELAYSAWE